MPTGGADRWTSLKSIGAGCTDFRARTPERRTKKHQAARVYPSDVTQLVQPPGFPTGEYPHVAPHQEGRQCHRHKRSVQRAIKKSVIATAWIQSRSGHIVQPSQEQPDDQNPDGSRQTPCPLHRSIVKDARPLAKYKITGLVLLRCGGPRSGASRYGGNGALTQPFPGRQIDRKLEFLFLARCLCEDAPARGARIFLARVWVGFIQRRCMPRR